MPSGITDVVIRLRRASPPWLRDGIDHAIAAERGPVAWLKEKALVRGEIPPSPSPRSDLPVRALIAPMNYAGQGREWARSLGGFRIEATNLAVDTGSHRGAAADWTVPSGVFTASRVWRARQRQSLPLFTHVMIESFVSPLGRGTGEVIHDDIAWLTDHGVRVALICHGTDVRLPHSHIVEHPHSPFADMNEPALAAAERSARANVRIAEDFGGPVFVSTPDLLQYVPSARWLPVVIETDRWASARPVDADLPVVLHIPSSALMKGTSHVDRAAMSLEQEGVIDYRRLQDIPSGEMPQRVGEADIVVDQLLLGSYGVAACEALAAGRVVVGNISEAVRAHVVAATGCDVPIVQADSGSLGEVLARLAADPAERARVGALGPAFVARVHSGLLTGPVLADYISEVG